MEKEISLFSAETLDSLAMAEIMGGECNNCQGGNCGNCVTQCSCTPPPSDGGIDVHVGIACGVKAYCPKGVAEELSY